MIDEQNTVQMIDLMLELAQDLAWHTYEENVQYDNPDS